MVAIAFLVSVTFLTMAPRQWLPGMALATFALVPITYTPLVNPVIGRYFSPALIIVAIWLIRTMFNKRQAALPMLWLITGGILTCWALLTATWSLDPQRTLLWTTTVCLVAVIPALLSTKSDDGTSEALSKSWLWLGLLLGVFAIVEGVTQHSILASLYQGTNTSSIGITQNWSSVRSTTTLGHPLMNATFFAASASYALINSALTRSKLALSSGVIASAGLVFTLSRSGVIALGAGLALGTIAILAAGKIPFARKFTFMSIAAAIGVTVISSPLVQARSNSSEGSNSAYLRDVLLRAGLRIAEQDDYLGAGAGTSNIRSSLAGMTLPLENSYVGILVSSGLAGLSLLVALFIGAIITALRRGRFDAAAGMAAFCIQIGAYPLIDNVPIAALMFGMLAYLGFSRHTKSENTQTLAERLGQSQQKPVYE